MGQFSFVSSTLHGDYKFQSVWHRMTSEDLFTGLINIYLKTIFLNHRPAWALPFCQLSLLPYLHTLQPLCGISRAFWVCMMQRHLCSGGCRPKLHLWCEKKGYLTEPQMWPLKAVFLLPRGIVFRKSCTSAAAQRNVRRSWLSSGKQVESIIKEHI